MISATRVPELLAEGLDLGSFLVNYGYDVTAWNESRKRIVQNIENKNNSRSLLAVCKLSEQLKRTVRDVGVWPRPLSRSVTTRPRPCGLPVAAPRAHWAVVSQ